MKKTKRFVSLVVALTLALSAMLTLVACVQDPCAEGHTFVDGKCTVCQAIDPNYTEHVCDYGVSGVCACGQQDPNAYYTQRSTMSLSPNVWNPFTYSSSNDSLILDYTTDSFYMFDYIDPSNPGLGFEIVPAMATSDPVDVTAEYVGTYTIAEGETGRAFRIELKDDLCFEDGTPINAQTYVDSFQRLLDPEMANSRASNYYTSSPAIVGAKTYAQSGWAKWVSATNNVEYSADIDDQLVFHVGPVDKSQQDGAIAAVRSQYNSDGYASYGWNTTTDAGTYMLRYSAAVGAAITNLTAAQINALEGKTVAEIKEDATLKATFDTLIAWWQEGDEGIVDFCTYYLVNEEVEFEGTVGVIAKDDHTLDIIYNAEVVGFYIKYTIGLPLVHIEKYDASISVDPTTGAKTSSYGTTYDSYIGCSYGPYKLTKFISGQVVEFERNTSWYGYSERYADEFGTIEVDGVTYKQYQTDKIVITQVQEIDTREQMFVAGQIDALGLNAAKLETYGGNDDLIYTEGYSTFYGIITSDYDALRAREIQMNGGDENSKKYNNTILSIKEFRQALSYAIDREELIRVLYPAGTAAFGLFSDGIVADPAAGKTYHAFDEAKEAICRVWGVEYGEGKAFETLDEAYNAIKGYDLQRAKELVNIAVDKAIDLGYMDSNSIVRIYHNESSESSTAKLWHSTFKGWFDKMVEGTKLEGKFEYLMDSSLGNDFSKSIRSGLSDCAWGFGWNGSALDPWGLCEVYVDAGFAEPGSYQYDPYNNYAELYPDVTISIDFGDGEKDYTFNLVDWWAISVGVTTSPVTGDELPNGAYGKISDTYRAKILAKIEECVLLQYTTIPIMNEGSVQLNSYKVRYYHLDDYVYGVGYGGIRYMTYNYTDYEWDAFVVSEGGTLNYVG